MKLHKLAIHNQERIIAICNAYTYSKAVQLLAQPPENGGLGLKTSRAALCRFLTRHHSSTEQAEALGQLARALLVRSHPAGQDVMAAVIAIIQQDVLQRLTSGSAVPALMGELRLLHRFHLDLFRLDKWKTTHSGHIQKDLEELLSAGTKEEETSDCDIIEEPRFPSAPEGAYENQPPALITAHTISTEPPQPYLDAHEGSLWPGQARRHPQPTEETPSFNYTPSSQAAGTPTRHIVQQSISSPLASSTPASIDNIDAIDNSPADSTTASHSIDCSPRSTQNPCNSTNSTFFTPLHLGVIPLEIDSENPLAAESAPLQNAA